MCKFMILALIFMAVFLCGCLEEDFNDSSGLSAPSNLEAPHKGTAKGTFSGSISGADIVNEHLKRCGPLSIHSQIYAEYRGDSVSEIYLESYQTMEQDGTRKTLLRVKRPERLRGAGLLLIKYKDREGDCWYFDPQDKRGKKINRIPLMQWKNSIFGTNFTYEDFEIESPIFYDYTYIKQEAYKNIPCHLIKAEPKSSNIIEASAFSRKYYWIRTDNFQILQIKFFDKRGTLSKILRTEEFVEVKKGIWKPKKIQLFDTKERTYTTLLYFNMEFKSQLSSEIFSIRELSRDI